VVTKLKTTKIHQVPSLISSLLWSQENKSCSKREILIHFKLDDDKKDVPPNSHPLWAHLLFSHLICYFLFLSAVDLSYKPKNIFHRENVQTTGNSSVFCMNKHQPQSIGINWYPLLWLRYQLPSIMNLIELWQSLHTLRFLIIWSSIPGGVLISPNAITSFSLWW
jgi:hypothetical protein